MRKRILIYCSAKKINMITNSINEGSVPAVVVVNAPEDEEVRNESQRRSTRKWRSVTAEPLVLFTTMVAAAVTPGYMRFLQQQTCLTLYNSTMCDFILNNSSFYSNQSDEVLSQVSQFTTFQSVAQDFPAVFTSWVIGSWGDRFSRKLTLYICLLSELSQYAVQLTVMCLPNQLTYQWVIVSNFICGLTGYTTLLAACSYVGHLSYLQRQSDDHPNLNDLPEQVNEHSALLSSSSNSSSRKQHSPLLTKYSLMNSMYYGGLALGYAASGWVTLLVGPINARILAVVSLLVLLIYNAVWIQDLPAKEPVALEFRAFFQLFGFANVTKPIRILCKARDGTVRKQLLLALASQLMYGIAITSMTCNFYWYLTDPPINLSPTQYGYFNCGNFAAGALALLIALPLLRQAFPNVDSALFALLGLLLQAYSQISLAVTTTPTQAFVLLCLLGFRGWICASLETIMSSLVPAEEQGVVFAAVSCGDRLFDMPAVMLFARWLYPATVAYFPGGAIATGGLGLLITAFFVVYLMFVRRKASDSGRSATVFHS